MPGEGGIGSSCSAGDPMREWVREGASALPAEAPPRCAGIAVAWRLEEGPGVPVPLRFSLGAIVCGW